MPLLVFIMAWSGEHRAFVIEEFINNGGSPISTQRAFRVRFALGRHDPVPDRKTIQNWVSNFRQTGSALKLKPPGRPKTATGPEKVAAVKASVDQSPQRSARKHAAALQLSDRSVRRILHEELKMHPYKIVVTQQLTERDWETRTTLCRDLLRNVPQGDIMLFTDEAHFNLSGTVNKQNFRYWSQKNPQELHQRPLHSPKVTVWCAIFEFGVWGPYFFEEDGVTATVTSNRYCVMLENFLRPKLNNLFNEYGQNNVWFQQDGATAHTARRSLGILREMFPGHIVSLRGDIGWPPRSPDLSPCDFFLWGYLKSQVYQHRPQTIEALKEIITQEVAAIPPEMTRRVTENYRKRLNQCIENEGRHLSDIIFKNN